jgi:alpha-D-xyloside xylohydrolase
MAGMHPAPLHGQPHDPSRAFHDPWSAWALPGAATIAADGRGSVLWRPFSAVPRTAFMMCNPRLEPAKRWDFPDEYGHDLELPFTVEPVGDRAVRIRIQIRPDAPRRPSTGILLGEPRRADGWTAEDAGPHLTWRGPHGAVRVHRDPWRIELLGPDGAVRWSTWVREDARAVSLHDLHAVPTAAVRGEPERRWQAALACRLAPGEALVGGGEHFGALDKRGQRLLWAPSDGHGVTNERMYKPVPFLISSRGWGMLLDTTAPVLADLGCSNHEVASLLLGEDRIELYLFLGSPAEVLESYTALSGRAPEVPLWSFGLWMSRITYSSETETREVASRLRGERIPCDVIHLDTGWFEHDWRCDYRFSTTRFADPGRMLSDLRADGFRVSLWQLPYYTPTNPLHAELVEAGLAISDGDGALPSADAVIDFSTPAAVAWYRGKLEPLLRLGVAAIKTDFAECAPAHGRYASGQSGLYERCRYPLRYQQAAMDATVAATGEPIIWARAAWAGSQRHPIHWGGDAEITDQAMLGSLRAGLSLGLCGFTYWSHDIGGFVKRSPADLYLRWLAFGALSSHARAHGAPPKEPWHYDEPGFVDAYRRLVELRYRLIPYLWAQAAACAARGQPMLRAMLLDDPDLPEAWRIEDQYRLGTDLLVAPLFHAGQRTRRVWLPPGGWMDAFTGAMHDGDGWHDLPVGELPVVLLVRRGALIPTCTVAQHTGAIEWSRLALLAVPDADGRSSGLVRGPDEAAGRRCTADGAGWQAGWSRLARLPI